MSFVDDVDALVVDAEIRVDFLLDQLLLHYLFHVLYGALEGICRQ